MPSKTQSLSSRLNKVKKCSLHGIFYCGICPLCNELTDNSSKDKMLKDGRS